VKTCPAGEFHIGLLSFTFILESWLNSKITKISLLSALLLESSLHSSPRTFQLNAQVPYFRSSEHPKKQWAKLSHALLRFSSMIPKIILAFLALLVKSEHDRPHKICRARASRIPHDQPHLFVSSLSSDLANQNENQPLCITTSPQTPELVSLLQNLPN
jgi:hypothetical protein